MTTAIRDRPVLKLGANRWSLASGLLTALVEHVVSEIEGGGDVGSGRSSPREGDRGGVADIDLRRKPRDITS